MKNKKGDSFKKMVVDLKKAPKIPNEKIKFSDKFKIAVESTADIKNGYEPGLNALGQYSKKITATNAGLLEGSVDIDKCTTAKYPDSHRWDYVLSYNSAVYFVEVHSAHASEVSCVLDKFKWLKDWINGEAPEIKKMMKGEFPFYWVQSKNFQIPKQSPQYRIIVSSGLRPIAELKLN